MESSNNNDSTIHEERIKHQSDDMIAQFSFEFLSGLEKQIRDALD